METRLLLAAFVLALAALALGAHVAQRPPPRIDLAAGVLRGTALPLAVFFTGLGRWPVLLGLGVLAFGIGMTLRTGLSAVVVLYGAQVASQAATALVKLAFHRMRPDTWLIIKETDLSYPSGHAVTAVVFFLGFVLLAWHAPLPRPVVLPVVAVLCVCAVGIPWSRLALGAHYLTDVAGGLLLGGAFLCTACAVILRFASAPAAP
ncbi:MAG: undecaprenyl-diphosphatase [Candidatus Eremiobacteraeota bacterium]|jgi:undecaprenyl-diphosphatase|nr:undecaprenyl-diphosphatase [Candidatus Eremiobacteraeota bacterium]